MPIVDVTIVLGRDEVVPPHLAQALANAVGRALGSPAAQTWIRLHVLAHDRYAENNAIQDETGLPVFVVVLAQDPPEQSQFAATVEALTRAIAEATGRTAENVHIEYAPAARGRMAFGGKLVL